MRPTRASTRERWSFVQKTGLKEMEVFQRIHLLWMKHGLYVFPGVQGYSKIAMKRKVAADGSLDQYARLVFGTNGSKDIVEGFGNVEPLTLVAWPFKANGYLRQFMLSPNKIRVMYGCIRLSKKTHGEAVLLLVDAFFGGTRHTRVARLWWRVWESFQEALGKRVSEIDPTVARIEDMANALAKRTAILWESRPWSSVEFENLCTITKASHPKKTRAETKAEEIGFDWLGMRGEGEVVEPKESWARLEGGGEEGEWGVGKVGGGKAGEEVGLRVVEEGKRPRKRLGGWERLIELDAMGGWLVERVVLARCGHGKGESEEGGVGGGGEGGEGREGGEDVVIVVLSGERWKVEMWRVRDGKFVGKLIGGEGRVGVVEVGDWNRSVIAIGWENGVGVFHLPASLPSPHDSESTPTSYSPSFFVSISDIVGEGEKKVGGEGVGGIGFGRDELVLGCTNGVVVVLKAKGEEGWEYGGVYRVPVEMEGEVVGCGSGGGVVMGCVRGKGVVWWSMVRGGIVEGEMDGKVMSARVIRDVGTLVAVGEPAEVTAVPGGRIFPSDIPSRDRDSGSVIVSFAACGVGESGSACVLGFESGNVAAMLPNGKSTLLRPGFDSSAGDPAPTTPLAVDLAIQPDKDNKHVSIAVVSPRSRVSVLQLGVE